MKTAYFIHDLTDAAAAKRVTMLRAGGCDLSIAGFRRGPAPVESIAGVPAKDLGETFDGALTHRAASVAAHVCRPAHLRRIVSGADVVVARNLEMLMIAAAAQRAYAPNARLVYECLDIHRVMLLKKPASMVLRMVERWLLSRCALLLISAPAFVSEYFSVHHKRLPPLFLQENKLLSLGAGGPRPTSAGRPKGQPWRIGWFGILRCRKSVGLLKRIVEESNGTIEVVIRGKPSPHSLPDLADMIRDTPGIRLHGAYKPTDLADIYEDVHFMWSVDYSDEGANSQWLLPNRIYEATYYNTPNIADRATATGHWLASHDAGLLVDDPVADVVKRLATLDGAAYDALEGKSKGVTTRALVSDALECRELVRALAASPARSTPPTPQPVVATSDLRSPAQRMAQP